MTDAPPPTARCEICGFVWSGRLDLARRLAQKHAEKTGHPVEVTSVVSTMPLEMGDE